MDDVPVEILVHIAAPSRAVDDVRYRALASAYTAFQPATRRPLHGLNEPSSEPLSSSTTYTSIFKRGKVASPAIDNSLESLQDQEGPPCSLTSPQASFGSVLDNAGSPSVVRAYRVPLSAPQLDSWQSPSSLVGDSQPEVSTAIADLTSPTRLLEYYLQGFDSFTSSSWSPSQQQGTVADGGQPEADVSQFMDHRVAPAIPGAYIPALTGVIPSSVPNDDSHESSLSMLEPRSVTAANNGPSHPVATTKGSLELCAMNDRDAVHTSSHVSLVPSSKPIALGRSDSEPSATPKPSFNTTRALHQALYRASSDLGPRSSTLHTVSSSTGSTADFSAVLFYSSHGYTLDSLELCAPEPPVANDTISPSDLITPQLRDLLADAQPRRRKSQPKTQTRAIRPMERGYWNVDCLSWSPDLKRATWAHLANWIGMGLAGWGTRCTRDEEFTRVRLYCWGETAPYMYYLLWLTSYRKILAVECAWVDADGKAVLVMGMC